MLILLFFFLMHILVIFRGNFWNFKLFVSLMTSISFLSGALEGAYAKRVDLSFERALNAFPKKLNIIIRFVDPFFK